MAQVQFKLGLIVDELIQQILRAIKLHPLLIARNDVGHEFNDLLL